MILADGLSLFLRQTLDAMDGKQARRTKQSSALGEFFDHGLCDAIEILVRPASHLSSDLSLFLSTLQLLSDSVVVLSSTTLSFLEWVLILLKCGACMWLILTSPDFWRYLTGKIHFWYFSFTESEIIGVITHVIIYFVGHNNIMGKFPGTELRYLEAVWYLVNFQFILAMWGSFMRIPPFLRSKVTWKNYIL